MNGFVVRVRENGLIANKRNYRQNRQECFVGEAGILRDTGI